MSIHDEDDDDVPCFRHPSQLTALRCLQCDRPICIDCAVAAPVGFKCPDHARTSRAARGIVPTQRIIRGLAAGALVALALGSILWFVRIPFLGIILAYLAGTATGESTRRASGGYRDPVLATGAAALAAFGMLALPIAALLGGAGAGSWIAWSLVAGIAAAYGAYTRAG
jgi:hypothetical protein